MMKSLLLLSVLCATVMGHGRLIKPMTRVGHDNYENDPVALDSSQWICRHSEQKGGVSPTSLQVGSTTALQWRFSAAHVGDCEVFLSYDVDTPRENMRWFKIANYLDCRADNEKDMPLKLPTWLKTGRVVLRWGWYALHQHPSVEFYSQCSELDLTGGQNALPQNLVTYPVTDLYPLNANIGVGYRYPFGGNGVNYVTGPACAQGMTDNSCDLTKAGTQGHLSVNGESPTIDPDTIPTNPPVDDNNNNGGNNDDTPNTTPPTVPVGDCISGVFVSLQDHIPSTWCQDTCSWNIDYCDPDICECDTDGGNNNGNGNNNDDDDNSGPTAPPLGNDNSLYKVIYIDWKLNWSDFASDIRRAADLGFNIINIAFYLEDAPADAAIAWSQLSAQQRTEVKTYLQARNAKIMLSAGGATFEVEDKIAAGVNTAEDWCGRVAEYVLQYDYDGVDFDIELQPGNNAPFHDGTAIDWLVACSNKARQVLGNDKLISHAPQAPYFGTWAGNQLGYTKVYERAPDAIDFLNIQYYNQGYGVYTTYQELFVASSSQPDTAVKEIHDNGIPLNKLVVGKPVLSSYAGSGYITGEQLHEFGLTACGDFNWNGGFMGWMYDATQDFETWSSQVSQNLCTLGENNPNGDSNPNGGQDNDDTDPTTISVPALSLLVTLFLFFVQH